MSADVLALGSQLDALMDAGAHLFHVDVMDGHFVPNLTLGTGFAAQVAAAAAARGGGLDVHLMVDQPAMMVELFAPHAAAMSVHVEADAHIHRTLGRIRELGCLAGLALNPGTPLGAVDAVAEIVDYVNVMSVNPGFSGQQFIAATPGRVRALRERLPSDVVIQVDGGVGAATLPDVRDAGARWFVAGSSIFEASDPVGTFTTLQGLAGE